MHLICILVPKTFRGRLYVKVFQKVQSKNNKKVEIKYVCSSAFVHFSLLKIMIAGHWRDSTVGWDEANMG